MAKPHRTTLTLALSVAAAGMLAWRAHSADAEVQPINNLPNPYRTVRDWAQPPGGGKWPAVTAVEVAPDGSIYVIDRCNANSCAGRTEPPILKFDPSGKLLESWGSG